jgi:hypothetical protein
MTRTMRDDERQRAGDGLDELKPAAAAVASIGPA